MDFRIEHIENGAIFRLSRPDKLNSTTPAIWAGLEALLDELETGGGRFLVVTGEGEKAFCAGTDLGSTTSLSADQVGDRCDQVRALLTRLSRSRLISVAALNGLAYGGGLELASACTFRVALPHVRLSVPEIKIAAMPAYGGTQFLTSLLGRAVALDLLLTGRVVPADEALRIGLVSRVVDGSTGIVDEAVALANSVCAHSAAAITAIREAVSAADAGPADDGMDREGVLARQIFTSEDCREGTAAFLEKRAPRFTGR